MSDLVERLEKRVEKEREILENNRVVFALLKPALDDFNRDRDDPAWKCNTYAVRLACDYRSGVADSEKIVAELEEAIALAKEPK